MQPTWALVNCLQSLHLPPICETIPYRVGKTLFWTRPVQPLESGCETRSCDRRTPFRSSASSRVHVDYRPSALPKIFTDVGDFGGQRG